MQTIITRIVAVYLVLFGLIAGISAPVFNIIASNNSSVTLSAFGNEVPQISYVFIILAIAYIVIGVLLWIKKNLITKSLGILLLLVPVVYAISRINYPDFELAGLIINGIAILLLLYTIFKR